MKRVLFAVLLVAAFGMFAWTVRRFARLIFVGRPRTATDRVGAAPRLGDALLLRPEEGRREDRPSRRARWPRFVTAHRQQVPLLDLLGLPRHHDRHGRDADPGAVPVVLAGRWSWATRWRARSTPCIDVVNLIVLVADRVRGLPPHRPAAAPDPDEPRRRRDPGRDRAADDHALRHPRASRRGRRRARAGLPGLSGAGRALRHAPRRGVCPRRRGGCTSSSC